MTLAQGTASNKIGSMKDNQQIVNTEVILGLDLAVMHRVTFDRA